MKVYHRAQAKMKQVRPSHRLAWVQQRIEGEIEGWVDKVRNTSATLGEIVRDTYDRREAIWQVDDTIRYEAEAPFKPPAPNQGREATSGSGGAKGGGGKGEQAQKPKQGKARDWAKQLRSGSQLCQNYNRGGCGNKKGMCKHGKHSCCGQQGNGRVCGQSHPAVACTNKKVQKY